jgi:chitin disaccharide deacetylase
MDMTQIVNHDYPSVQNPSARPLNHIINVHADDFGLNREITDNILACIQQGAVNSISIVCNTGGLPYAGRQLKKLPEDVRVCLHLNFVEGSPVSARSEVGLLIDESGEFKHSFLFLWLKYMLSSKSKKELLRQQVRTEIVSQINKYKETVGAGYPLRMDSHMHFHMIPFVNRIIFDMAEEIKLEFIRNPHELRYFYPRKLSDYFSSNLVKHLLLNYLAKKQRAVSDRRQIGANVWFIGVLATGNMTFGDVEAALRKISKAARPLARGLPGPVDILFHPGGVDQENKVSWTCKKAFFRYYSHPNRRSESATLTDPKLLRLIEHYENILNH